MNTLVAITRTTLAKDLRLEWRSKDALNAMLFFGLLVVVIFSFAFDPTAEESRHIAGGLIWVAFLFAAVVALNQTWARELRNQVLDAYRVAPAPPRQPCASLPARGRRVSENAKPASPAGQAGLAIGRGMSPSLVARSA